MTKTKLRFVVPHSLFGEGLIYMLAALDRYEIDENPDIIIADQSMLDMVGDSNARLIVVGRDIVPAPAEFERMIKLGVCGYVRSGATRDTLVHIIELVLHDNSVWPAEVLESLRHAPFRPAPAPIMLPPPVTQRQFLTPRETELMYCLRDGLSNKHIAQRTNLAESTVKVHVRAIMRKLRVNNRTQVAVWMENKNAEV